MVNVCIDYKSSVVSTLNLSVPTPILDNLQRLKVKFQLSYDDLKRLQMFPKLVQLEVGLLEIGLNTERIKLARLKILHVADVNHEERGFLTIDAPCLKNVCFGEKAIDFIKFDTYDTVETLEFCKDKFGSCLVYSNVRLAICNQILDLQKSTLIALAKLPELCSLHCNIRAMKSTEDKPEEPGELKRLQEVYDLLMRLENSGEVNSDLNCFIHGVSIVRSKPFDDYQFAKNIMNLHVLNAHHTLSEKFPSIEAISYSNFFRSVTGVSRSIFLKRYLNIQEVDVFGDAKKFKFSKLLAFLSLCKYVRSLLICFVDITNEELAQLPGLKSLAMLNSLQLIHNRRTDLNFLSRWDFLDRLKTNLVNVDGIDILQKLNPNGVYEFFLDGQNSIVVRKHVRRNSYDMYLVLCGESMGESHENVTFGGLTEILYRTNGLFPRTHWLDRGDTTNLRTT